MNLVCMFIDDLEGLEGAEGLVPVEVLLCIPAETKERMSGRAVPAKLVGTICVSDTYHIPTSTKEIGFYLFDLNKILTLDDPYLKTTMHIYRDNIARIREVTRMYKGKLMVNINLNATDTTLSEESTVHVSEVSSATMYSQLKCAIPEDTLYICP